MSKRLLFFLMGLAISTAHNAAFGQIPVTLLSASLVTCSTPCDGCEGGCSSCCTKEICVGNAKVVKEKKTCYKIECKTICVPQVRFPWECGEKLDFLDSFRKCGSCVSACCVPPKCGVVLKVRDFTKDSYEVDVCEYTMDVKTVPACSCGGGCTSPGCCANAQPTQSLQAEPVAPTRQPTPPSPVVAERAEKGRVAKKDVRSIFARFVKPR